jgi:pyruvate,water dikinase
MERFRKALQRLRRGKSRTDQGDTRSASFRLRYERFREILAFNDSTLELIADIEELLGGHRRFSLHSISRRVRKATMDVFLMVKNLNLIANMRHTALYQILEQLNQELEAEVGAVKETGAGRLVLPLSELRACDVSVAGSKMAHLGEIRGGCGLPVPDGFAITTEAFVRFMSAGGLWDNCQRLDASLESTNLEALANACRDVQESIRSTPVEPELADAIGRAFRQHFPEPGALVAIRSSASGEDSAVSSHAGLYHTELNTDETRLLNAYRAVRAAFSGVSRAGTR